jgi:hypothetical protein
MYKYKKTIILNNRRRRIFSKEKSNAEYILYKNDYITLNAYNKKTGGTYSFMKPIDTFRKLFKGKNDTSENIKTTTTTNPDEDEDEYRKKEELIKYGNEMTNEMFYRYIDKYYESLNFQNYDKIEILNLFLTNYLNIRNHINIPKNIHELEKSNIIHFKDYNINNSLYKQLEADNYYIYYVIKDIKDLKLDVEHNEILTKYNEYIEGGYYELFKDTIFKCTKINKIDDKFDKYDIVFKYNTCSISDLINKSEQIQRSESKIIEYGIRKHQEIFKNYNKNTDKSIDYFNRLIQGNVENAITDNNKILYYYNLANDNTKKIYNELSRIGYYIYTLKRNTTYTKHQNHNINNSIFRYIGNYTIDDDIISVLQYIITEISGGGQRKLKNIKFKKNLK